MYLRQTTNDLTGEHTCVMLKTLEGRDDKWLHAFTKDFHKRFINLLSYSFSKFPSVQALSVLEASRVESHKNAATFDKNELDKMLTPFDLKRLESYANNLIDYHVILDLLPYIAYQYFSDIIRDEVSLSHVQSAILLAIGLQHKELDDISKELNIETNQSLAMFSKIVRKVSQYFRSLVKESIVEELPEIDDDEMKELNGEEIPTVNDVEEMERELEADLAAAGNEALEEIRERKEKQKELINNLNLDKYKITDVSDWSSDKKSIDRAIKNKGTVSLKKGSKRKPAESAEDVYKSEMKALAKDKSKSTRGKKSRK